MWLSATGRYTRHLSFWDRHVDTLSESILDPRLSDFYPLLHPTYHAVVARSCVQPERFLVEFILSWIEPQVWCIPAPRFPPAPESSPEPE
jgi:hypothetical protein